MLKNPDGKNQEARCLTPTEANWPVQVKLSCFFKKQNNITWIKGPKQSRKSKGKSMHLIKEERRQCRDSNLAWLLQPKHTHKDPKGQKQVTRKESKLTLLFVSVYVCEWVPFCFTEEYFRIEIRSKQERERLNNDKWLLPFFYFFFLFCCRELFLLLFSSFNGVKEGGNGLKVSKSQENEA